MLQQILEDSFKAQNNISFSGFSIEKIDNSFKIHPWKDSFDENAIYRVAINENYYDKLSKTLNQSIKISKRFSDIRKTFVDGLRKVDGKVELKRAFY